MKNLDTKCCWLENLYVKCISSLITLLRVTEYLEAYDWLIAIDMTFFFRLCLSFEKDLGRKLGQVLLT